MVVTTILNSVAVLAIVLYKFLEDFVLPSTYLGALTEIEKSSYPMPRICVLANLRYSRDFTGTPYR